MTNKEILTIAMQQSAIDSNCRAEDFKCGVNKVVLSSMHPNARKYLALPLYCDLTSYGSSIVASVHSDIADAVQKYINKYPVEHCFETPNMQVLNDELKRRDMCICYMAEYFLPDVNIIKPLACEYETKIMKPEDFAGCYLPEWSNALCKNRKHLDTLAVGAFENGKLVGLSGCSADCETMWQIGVDVLPEYRRVGIATALISQLAIEILRQGIIPFYCAAWSNIKSVRSAISSGFKPAWVQITAKSIDFVSDINK